MSEIHNRVHLNSADVPVRLTGELDLDFEARMEYFRKNDLRIAIDGKGKVNYAFDHNYTIGNGVIGNGDDKPRMVMRDGRETGAIYYNPNVGGSFSVK